jgi:DNA-binding winged helix-turn-helix (wHTH) protein/predicted ATPase
MEIRLSSGELHQQMQPITFGPFVLDRANARLLRDGRDVALTPKSFDVLCYLAERADQLVKKEELLSAVWPDVVVGDASIKGCVREIRKALDDDADSPKYIQTVHRRGYRFIAEAGEGAVEIHQPASTQVVPAIVGRSDELDALNECLGRALAGQRQITFVIGPPGSGKTALVEAFVQSTGGRVQVAVGHCFEQFGVGEPYLPVWEALSRSPGLTTPDPLPSTERPAPTEPRQGSERMLRDLADTIEAAAERPLLLILEDLHWADYSTLDLVSAIARRRGAAKLMVVGTYRPGEAPEREQPLRAIGKDLRSRQARCELTLSPLDETAVGEFLAGRFPDRRFPGDLSRRLFEQTGGHPLFLASIVDELVEHAEDPAWTPQIPADVRAAIETQFERLAGEEQQVLEAAAVAGVEFSAAAVAGALGRDVVGVERVCEALTRRQRFLESCGAAEWPDGTLATQYRFVHELYHNVVAARLPDARRTQMHRALAVRLEEAWGSRCGENAAELALHFEQGRDFVKALEYLRRCAERATQQYAHREAIDYLRRALAALDRLPESDRPGLELPLLQSLGVHLQVTQGFAAPEVRQVQARAYGLCRSVSDVRLTFPVLWGIWLFHKVRSELHRAEQLARELLAIAQESGDPSMLVQARQAVAVTALCLGDPRTVVRQMEHVNEIYDQRLHGVNTTVFGQDPCVATTAFAAVAMGLVGDDGQAVQTSERALELAHSLGQPSSVALATHFAAMLHQHRGDAEAVGKLARATIDIAEAEGFSFWLAGGMILGGWAMAASGNTQNGVAEIRRGIAAWLATGSRTYHTYHLGLLADALLRDGRAREALEVLEDALAAAGEMPEGIAEAELWRLKGRCLLEVGEEGARTCFGRAVEVAKEQGASALEGRALAEWSGLSRLGTPGSSRRHQAAARGMVLTTRAGLPATTL